MKMNIKLFVFLFCVFFISVGLTAKTNILADGDIEVFRHMEGDEGSYIEVITDKTTSQIALEAYNSNDEISHFFVLKEYLGKMDGELARNSFYITNKFNEIDSIDKLYMVTSRNVKKQLIIQELTNLPEEARAFSAVDDQNNVEEGRRLLKVMSYNIHHGKDIFGRHSLDEIAQIIKDTDADIIGLQEVDNGVARSRFKDQIKYLAEKLSMNYIYGHNHNLLGGKYGNGILSKYPVENYENLYLPSGREQRGLLSASINVDGRQMDFLVTHLGLNQGERHKQIKSIMKYLETLSNPVVLLGDFNARSDAEEMRLLQQKLIDTAALANKDKEATFNLPILSERIDYIFLEFDFSPRSYEVIKSRASDHYPITATFEWD